ncbi:MAG: crossover junction endodeoxyribonuclease RuvC [Patescibacteria group bacterium]|jgi:crossover junction endodeoxyribonuclease RuvC|nr:crossover junction endodeoxyribonuclease RuvC [Patescibacteria group bacterium]
MRIISIDPGYDRLGVSVMEKDVKGKEVVLFSDCFLTDKKESLEKRILFIGQEVKSVIKKWSPTHMAIEKLFFTKNQTTAMKVAEVRGVVIYEASQKGIIIHEFSPQDIKIAVTGYGNASKDQVSKMTEKILSLSKKKRLDDEMDALALGVTALAHNRK